MLCIKSNNYKTNSMIILGLIFIIMGSALIVLLIMSEQTDGLTIIGSVSSMFLIIGGAGCKASLSYKCLQRQNNFTSNI